MNGIGERRSTCGRFTPGITTYEEEGKKNQEKYVDKDEERQERHTVRRNDEKWQIIVSGIPMATTEVAKGLMMLIMVGHTKSGKEE